MIKKRQQKKDLLLSSDVTVAYLNCLMLWVSTYVVWFMKFWVGHSYIQNVDNFLCHKQISTNLQAGIRHHKTALA